jgi:hypothetical protein
MSFVRNVVQDPHTRPMPLTELAQQLGSGLFDVDYSPDSPPEAFVRTAKAALRHAKCMGDMGIMPFSAEPLVPHGCVPEFQLAWYRTECLASIEICSVAMMQAVFNDNLSCEFQLREEDVALAKKLPPNAWIDVRAGRCCKVQLGPHPTCAAVRARVELHPRQQLMPGAGVEFRPTMSEAGKRAWHAANQYQRFTFMLKIDV